MLTYAIGDIHGCLRPLQDLLDQVAADADGPDRLVFLGDYIDRGPDSAGVISCLRRLQAERSPGQVICLKGNHEDLMLGALGGRLRGVENWLANGGEATLASFGVDQPGQLPADVVEWVEALPTCFEDGTCCFVHAGLDPARSRTDQSDRDRLWIRDAFLFAEHDFGKLVVHGHTPERSGRPDLRRHRLNLDTACVYGGRLTAARFGLDDPRPEKFLSVPGLGG